MDKELEELSEKYNENNMNFIATEALKIYKESEDKNIKLQALELLKKIEW